MRYTYSSLITPRTVLDYDLKTGERAVKKIQPVLGGYDPKNYVTKRFWATAEDGVKVSGWSASLLRAVEVFLILKRDSHPVLEDDGCGWCGARRYSVSS